MKKQIRAVIMAAVLLTGCASAPAESSVQTSVPSASAAAVSSGHFNPDTPISEVMSEEVFGDYGRLMFPVQQNYMSGTTLGDLQLTWYHNIDPDKTAEIADYFYDQAVSGETLFLNIYSDEEKAEDPDKADTGLFFFRGNPGAKTAIVNAGGGFAYVGAMQDSFPVSLELSKLGYNAFALIYRPGSDTACEDLARAIAYLEEHADELQIDMTEYSLWGGSAGARMADWVGTNGTAAYGEAAYPQPAMVVTQYTGLSEVTGNEPPTYANVGTSDGIASASVMQDRIQRLQEAGIDAEIEVFDGLAHGFGLGTGTVAEGWVNHAVEFWRNHMTAEEAAVSAAADPVIPDAIEEIPSDYFAPADQQGTLEDLYYSTWESFSYADHSQALEKHAVVYLPYGYDPDRQYDVFYLMHGGWSDETTTLGTPDAPGTFRNILDHAMEDGVIRPLIIVCPTYNNTNENGRDSDNFSLAMRLTDQFHQELLNDLMPAVEGKYSTYAEDTTPEAFAASRDHRGFGGFSMGSVTTWHTFQYCLDEFRYFLPMSCGTSLDDETIWQAAEGHGPGDYFVFVMTGTEDFAYQYDTARTEAMAESAYFDSIDDNPDGNFAFRVKEGYSHDGRAASEYTYNGLKAFFPGSAA
ncbi:MAG: alpha/beta hydrolase-fold protein [Bulleidia sp.]